MANTSEPRHSATSADAPDSLHQVALRHLDAIVAAKRHGSGRVGQRQLCEEIARAVSGGANSIAQAGTGTGKTYAYLAVATAALRGGRDGEGNAVRRVVVVTATKALQEQLVTEDLPAVLAALRPIGFSFTFGLLKGRNNYLCVSKHDNAQQKAAFDNAFFDGADAESARVAGAELEKIESWAAMTVVGDRAEIDPAVSDVAWRAVSAGNGECPGKKVCSVGDACFSEVARERAKSVDILVVNAALYATDVISGSGLCGDHQLVIIDEAHEFDAAVTDADTVTLAGSYIRAAARAAQKAGAGAVQAAPLIAAAEVFDNCCHAVVNGSSSPTDGVLVTVDDTWVEALDSVSSAVVAVSSHLAAPQGGAMQANADERARALTGLAAIEQVCSKISGRNPHMAAWVKETRGGRREMSIAPIDVSGILATTLWSKTKVVATSATLAHAGSLDGYARRVGASNSPYATSDVPSPFDYRSNGLLYVAKHLPEPRSEQFQDLAAHHVLALVRAAGGRTLSLHTSYKAMQHTASVLRSELAGEPIKVLVQGEASRDVLIRELRDAADGSVDGVVVCATQSFWTGVDVAGDGLICVVIDKLPFARPTDPLSAARRKSVEERGGNPFSEIDVPRAASLLAQGAGRLIRSVSDRGVVAVLDHRLATKAYRVQLLATIPPFRRSVSAEDAMLFLSGIVSDLSNRQDLGPS